MTNKIRDVVIVGGGTSGWMTAATFLARLPDKKITLIESPDIPTVGVGESTLGWLNNWCQLIGINDTDFMEASDANYKLSISFEDFYRKGSGSFHYPFGRPDINGSVAGINDWYYKKFAYPETPLSDFADTFFPTMALVNQHKIFKNEDDSLEGFNFKEFSGYQFDATKFGLWLRDHFCIPKGLNYIVSEVKDITCDDSGIKYLSLEDGSRIKGDLFIDCTGFKSLLLGEALKEPFEPVGEILPNNSAWATKIPYKDKESEMVLYTNCTAIENGWVWNIPLWSRIGAGYVYSDKYVSDEEALEEFKRHLKSKGHDTDLEYKNIKMRTGVHKRLWVKNVCAIGLSSGFIEPLESGGLLTTHQYLLTLIRVLDNKVTSQWDKDTFNFSCRDQFREFSQFVALHYTLSRRDDTQYWRDNLNREYGHLIDTNELVPSVQGFTSLVYNKVREFRFWPDAGGIYCIATGMNWLPIDEHALAFNRCDSNVNLHKDYAHSWFMMDKRKEEWNRTVFNKLSPYRYLTEAYNN